MAIAPTSLQPERADPPSVAVPPAGPAPPARPTAALLAVLLVGSVVAVDPWGLTPFGPLRVTVVGVATLLGAAAALRHRPSPHRPTAVAWAALLSWLLLATLTAVDPLHAWIGTPDRRFGLVTWVLLALAFVAGQTLTTARDARRLLRAGAVAALVLGVSTAAELLGLAPVDVAFAGGRVGGPYGQPAFLGAAAVLLVPLSAGLALDPAEGRRWRLLAALATLGGTAALLASQTRGAWLGLLAATALLLPRLVRAVRRHPTRALAAAALAAAALVVLALVTPLGGRAVSALDLTSGTSAGRLDEWRVAVRAIADRPWLGAGPEGYRITFAEAVDADYERAHGRDPPPGRAHSGPLDVAVAGGLPAAAANLALTALVLLACWRATRPTRPPWLAGAATGVAAVALQELVLFPTVEVSPLAWAVAGLVVAHTTPPTAPPTGPRTAPPAGPRASRPTRRPPRLVAPLVLLAAAGAVLVAGTLEVLADHDLRRAVEADGPFDHPEALALTDRATARRPDSIRSWYAAASLARRGGTILDLDAAIDRLTEGLARSPRDPALRTEHAALLLERAQRSQLPTDVEAALAALEDLVADDPVNATHRLRLGIAHALDGDLDAARHQLELAADLAPRSTAPPLNLAELHLRRGDADAATAALDRAAAIDPDDPRVAALRQQITEGTR